MGGGRAHAQLRPAVAGVRGDARGPGPTSWRCRRATSGRRDACSWSASVSRASLALGWSGSLPPAAVMRSTRRPARTDGVDRPRGPTAWTDRAAPTGLARRRASGRAVTSAPGSTRVSISTARPRTPPLRLLAPRTRTRRARAWSMRPIPPWRQVVPHAEALHDDLAEELRPPHDAAARVDRGDVEHAVVDHGVGQELLCRRGRPQLPIMRERSRASTGGESSSWMRARMRRPCRWRIPATKYATHPTLALAVVVGVGDHRGVEPEARDDEEDVLLARVPGRGRGSCPPRPRERRTAGP